MGRPAPLRLSSVERKRTPKVAPVALDWGAPILVKFAQLRSYERHRQPRHARHWRLLGGREFRSRACRGRSRCGARLYLPLYRGVIVPGRPGRGNVGPTPFGCAWAYPWPSPSPPIFPIAFEAVDGQGRNPRHLGMSGTSYFILFTIVNEPWVKRGRPFTHPARFAENRLLLSSAHRRGPMRISAAFRLS